MKKIFRGFVAYILEDNRWKKLAVCTVKRGKTALPLVEKDLKNYGVRLDYDGFITKDGIQYHKCQIQPNAGDDIPFPIKNWMSKNGNTHSVITNVFVKTGGTREDVQASLEAAINSIWGK